MTGNKSGLDVALGASGPPFDPDDFTPPDWGVIYAALRRNAIYLEHKAERSPENKRPELLAAAQRRYRLAVRALQARRFRQEMDREFADDQEADQAGAQSGPAPAPGAVRAGADRA